MAAVVIGRMTFTTKAAAKAHFQAMLARYEPGNFVSDSDQAEIEELLQTHPEREQKIGCGVFLIFVQSACYGTKCFGILRQDLSDTDFSYASCLTPPKPKTEALSAFRQVVSDDIRQAKRAKFAQLRDDDGCISCPDTGSRLSFDDCHADHQQPMTFEVICTTFLAQQNLGWTDVPVSYPQDQQFIPTITRPDLAESFRAYHHKVAQIRLVSRHSNLKAAGKHRLRKKAADRESSLDL